MKVDQVIHTSIDQKQFLWVDILNPSSSELHDLSVTYQLPENALIDCLDAEHLPKYERIDDLNFVILRVYDDSAAQDADTVQELTRKVAVFQSAGRVITIHRSELTGLSALRESWRNAKIDHYECLSDKILLQILRCSIDSYAAPMMLNRNLLEVFEEKIFKHQGDTFEDGYYLKRRANTFRRMLRLSMDILPRIGEYYTEEASILQDIKETGDRLIYYAEEFYENINNLVGLHLSLSSYRLTLASHRTNEVVRLLTIFSVFFMPLNLITGIYGMNFEHMPELKSEHGYHLTLAMMAIVSSLIAFYFYKRGLFKGEKAD